MGVVPGEKFVDLAGLDQRGDDSPVLGAGVVSREEGFLTVQGDGTDRAFDGIAVDLDATVDQDAGRKMRSGQRLP